MAGFRKAKAEQAALKIGIYGASGRGKTLTALMMAEGLVRLNGKRIAFVDTEHGTDFYVKDVPARKAHPKSFDFDALYDRSITAVAHAVRSLNPENYGVIVIDSITHLWEAARAAWNGKTNKNGALPMYAWAQIKKPYKDLMAYLLATPVHVIFCGREGNVFEEDEDTGETKAVGKKMKAEGETPYEPHMLIHMMDPPGGRQVDEVWCHVEKDRSGMLKGQRIRLWPNDQGNAFELLCAKWLPLLGETQAAIPTEDDCAARDAEALGEAEQNRIRESERILSEFAAEIQLAKSSDALKAVGKRITPEVKKRMMPADVSDLRTKYQEREQVLSGERRIEPVEA